MAANRSPSVDDCATFFCYADEISNVVQNVVLGHLAYPDLPTNFVLRGEKYILHAKRKEWKAGKDYCFKWGEEVINAAAENNSQQITSTIHYIQKMHYERRATKWHIEDYNMA
ncbi:hypothetical protein LENED_002173 [Lentinula edodes]|uniref:Uncharacterized protein n=1 Tax=Lentinula edodes TaxID=5353 RepID=A0A1Q3E052_LENED|nr:hypothetical protein LENED_002173 [Lentinula edodes]